MKIIIDKDIPFIHGVFEPCAETLYLPDTHIAPDTVKEADALIIRTRTRCNRELLSGSKVRFIASATIGYDHIDIDLCREKGIAWCNAPGCNAYAVCQYLLCALSNLSQKHSDALNGKTLGIIGAGAVGAKVEQAARAIGMKVLLNDPPLAENDESGRYSDLNTLLLNADYLSLHVPLTSAGPYPTKHLANSAFFDKLKPGAIFINTSRGETVDENALKSALKSGRLRGAALDVWNSEPNIDGELVALADLATFHVAGYSVQGKMNAAVAAANGIILHFNLPLQRLAASDFEPSEPRKIIVNTDGESFQSIIARVMKATYDIEHDSARLKSSPQDFERLRNSYDYRQEPASYSVKLKGRENETLAKTLRELGFAIIG